MVTRKSRSAKQEHDLLFTSRLDEIRNVYRGTIARPHSAPKQPHRSMQLVIAAARSTGCFDGLLRLDRERTADDFVVTFADAMEPSQRRVPRPGGRLYPSALTVDLTIDTLTVDTLIVDVTVDTLIVDVTVDMDAAG